MITGVKTHKCIFCLDESESFNTIEHIVPESLGNTDDIIKGAICDKCQNYFGREIENFVLTKTPFAFWRTIYRTKTKQGKDPFFNMTLYQRHNNKLSNFHPFSDNNVIIHPAYAFDESIIEAEINNKEILEKIQNGEKNQFNLVLTPKILAYMGRFLGKIALEYWFKFYGENVFEERFNELRYYARYGTTNAMWPIFNWKLADNLLIYEYISKDLQEHTLYRYGYGKIVKNDNLIFVFDIGTERYGIIMDDKYPNLTYGILSKLFEDVQGTPNILYYNRLTQ